MARLLHMPEVAANSAHATLAAWTVHPGAAFGEGDSLAEIETDKATLELPAEHAGVMGEQLVAAGQDVAVGSPICVLLAAGEEPVAAVTLGLGSVGPAPIVEGGDRRPTVGGPRAGRQGRPFSSPVARRYARELGIDISSLTGRGPNGRVVRRDVEAAADGPERPTLSASQPPAVGDDTEATLVPHTRLRRAIARRLSESKATIPHFYLAGDIRVDSLLALRGDVNRGRVEKFSMTDFLVRAVASALQRVPAANVSWSEDAMHQHAHADVAVAVATDGGLITPIIRSAETKTLSTLSAELADLVDRARSGRLRPDEFEGGSFTISNLGMYRTESFAAIINPPQSAILAVGAARKAPVVDGESLVVGTLMHATLSVDHRAIDGALAAKWFAAFKDLIETPASALV